MAIPSPFLGFSHFDAVWLATKAGNKAAFNAISGSATSSKRWTGSLGTAVAFLTHQPNGIAIHLSHGCGLCSGSLWARSLGGGAPESLYPQPALRRKELEDSKRGGDRRGDSPVAFYLHLSHFAFRPDATDYIMKFDDDLLTHRDNPTLPGSLCEAVSDRQFWIHDSSNDFEVQEIDEVVIDCGAIERVSSDDLNHLIRFYGEMRHESTRVKLTNVGETLSRVFRMTRLDRLFIIERSMALSV